MPGIIAAVILILLAVSFVTVLFWYLITKKFTVIKKSSGILLYHRICTKPVLGTTWAYEFQFKKQLKCIKEAGYKCVNLKNRINDQKAGEFAIAFDDALEELWRFALPALLGNDCTATFFIVSDYIGKISEWDVYKQKHMTKEQIFELVKSGHRIGSHTATHPDLTKISDRNLFKELADSKKYLEDTFGVEIEYLSYPFGRFNSNVQNIAKECGYKGALTINHSLTTDYLPDYSISANAVYVFDGYRNIKSKIDGGKMYWLEELKNKILNRFASGTSLVIHHPMYDKDI